MKQNITVTFKLLNVFWAILIGVLGYNTAILIVNGIQTVYESILRQ